MRRKFKLLGVSSQVRALDNGITCCYWSASLSNRLRALKAHSSSFKCCEKNCPNYMCWIRGKHRGCWVWVFCRFYCPFEFLRYFYIFFNSRGRCHWQGTASGPKSHIGRSKKWHWQGRKVTQGPKSHIGVLQMTKLNVTNIQIFHKNLDTFTYASIDNTTSFPHRFTSQGSFFVVLLFTAIHRRHGIGSL